MSVAYVHEKNPNSCRCDATAGIKPYEEIDLPENWPDHLDAAVLALNNRILPALKFSPDELLYGLVINTAPTPLEDATTPVDDADAGLQMAYMGQLRLDGYSEMVDHAVRRKAQFDKKVMTRAPKAVIFKTGSLVQVYNTDYEVGATFRVERKMVPMWSAPRRITSRSRNSYKIETLEGLPIGGRVSTRHLRQFVPRRSTILHALQEEWMAGLEELGREDIEEVEEDEAIEKRRGHRFKGGRHMH